jgi:hypothetical protein
LEVCGCGAVQRLSGGEVRIAFSWTSEERRWLRLTFSLSLSLSSGFYVRDFLAGRVRGMADKEKGAGSRPAPKVLTLLE